MNESGQHEERRSRDRLVTIEDLAERVRALEEERSKLTITAAELRGVLKELVEACEAGGNATLSAAMCFINPSARDDVSALERSNSDRTRVRHALV